MRDLRSWREPLLDKFYEARLNTPRDIPLTVVCNVELGLRVLEELLPEEPAESLPYLLGGYEFPMILKQNWGKSQRCMWTTARHLLVDYRSPHAWQRATKQYLSLPEALRRYNITPDGFERKEVSICSKRDDIYGRVLATPVPHLALPVRWARAGHYEFKIRERIESIEFPQGINIPHPTTHNSTKHKTHTQLHVTWWQLEATAQWMDDTATANNVKLGRWFDRLQRVRLELRQKSGAYTPVEELSINRMLHLVGMVSSGKSTLMEVLAVWAAREGYKVTLVVGDVLGALQLAARFRALGVGAAPVLGASGRKGHLERLNRALAAEGVSAQPQNGEWPEEWRSMFRWLSTVCPLEGLRAEEKQLEIGEQPCFTLKPHKSSKSKNGEAVNGNASNITEPRVCPFYGACPWHAAQRDLVEAPIWVATLPSLIFTTVPAPLGDERLRMAELAFQRSDLVIVDEADRVQVQLDQIFNPHEVLVNQGENALLSQIRARVNSQLDAGGRAQLARRDIEQWNHGHTMVQNATDRLYGAIQEHNSLEKWLAGSHYFTARTLLHGVTEILCGRASLNKVRHEEWDEAKRTDLLKVLNKVADKPIDDDAEDNEEEDSSLRSNAAEPLRDCVRRLLTQTNRTRVRGDLESWVRENKSPSVVLSSDHLKEVALRLEFALLVATLQNRLIYLLRGWRQAEIALQLGEGGEMRFRPPDEYRGVLPTPPMGLELAFQYLIPVERNGPGELRYYRCYALGRWMLHHFHELFAGDGIAGPNVLLMSGTSWAASSTSYHVSVPVGGILRAPDEEVDAIRQSLFMFDPVLDVAGNAISVSGRHGPERSEALRAMVTGLARSPRQEARSRLESILDGMPENRQRILLLSGNYEEAREACEHLCSVRSDWANKAMYLVGDNTRETRFEDNWWPVSAGGPQLELPRGQVHRLAQTGAQFLFAPLGAVERGHNILTESGECAALGAVLFLVRPHPRPDDLSHALHGIARWATDNVEHYNQETLLEAGQAFRSAAHKAWHDLVVRPLIWSRLAPPSRESLTWTQLVSIWQVIGRLVRGGVEARVYFCDARFADKSIDTDDEIGDTPVSSLLVSMREVLQPYFEPAGTPPQVPAEAALVQTLYGPLYEALKNMGGLRNNGNHY